MENKKQGVELADIFRSHAGDFLGNHQLCSEQRKAFDAIISCRTASLGGHMDQCEHCGYTRISYNSCRNRHCPKCQFVKKVQWVDKLAGSLPPVRHFHVIFTIPRCLHQLFYLNQGKAYGLLFQAAGKALLHCASNPKLPGAYGGAVALLHTWGQTLTYHPHIHMIVPAGGLSEDHMEWVPSGKKFFLPVKVLSAVFRGILCNLLAKAIMDDEIKLPDELTDFTSLRSQCYQKKWVVYCKKPFANVDNLIQYLSNYAHRVAISNHRLREHKDDKVSFCYKDYNAAGLTKCITLDSSEFIRRFLQHILPARFYKIRYFGFMAMCNKKLKLALCFDLIEKTAFLPVLEGLSAVEVWRSLTGIDPLRCPQCKTGRMKLQLPLIFDFEPG